MTSETNNWESFKWGQYCDLPLEGSGGDQLDVVWCDWLKPSQHPARTGCVRGTEHQRHISVYLLKNRRPEQEKNKNRIWTAKWDEWNTIIEQQTFHWWYIYHARCLKGWPSLSFHFLFVVIILFLFFCIYKCRTLGHWYKEKSYFTPLISSVEDSLGFGLMILMFFWWCWWRGVMGPSLLTLCCRPVSWGCCCHCALWFQSYPAWETLFHFLPSAVISWGGGGGGNAEVSERSEAPPELAMMLR